MIASLNDTMAYLSGLAKYAVAVWVAFWGIRRKYELDYKLDRTGHIIRWSIILGGFSLALLRGPEFKDIRTLAAILVLAFLAWPNFAYHLARMLRRWRLLPNPDPADLDQTNQPPR